MTEADIHDARRQIARLNAECEALRRERDQARKETAANRGAYDLLLWYFRGEGPDNRLAFEAALEHALANGSPLPALT